MKFAYADPPYPGQAKRWYGRHPDYAGEVDHAELIARLCREYPDGWALSTNMVSLQYVLSLCPSGVGIAVWYQNNSGPGFMQTRWHLCWEPVIVYGGRPNRSIRNVLVCPITMGFVGGKVNGERAVAGQKPAAFCRWLFGLLGAQPDDELDDLFPGSGTVGAEWRAYQAQGVLAAI